MAPANYYTKKELTKIGLDGFALIDEFYGRGRKGRNPNYGGHDSYVVTSRRLPPPPPPQPTAAAAIPALCC
nr:uncharacterized protein LOC109176262 [Ipomoea trifida]